MVMIFSHPLPRKQLLEKGFVATFRTKHRKTGKDWANDGRGRKKICDIYIYPLYYQVKKPEDLADFVEDSGFDHLLQWVKIIKQFHKINQIRGFVYFVVKRR